MRPRASALKDDIMRFLLRLSAATMILWCGAAAAASHQDWQISHQADRFVDRVMMEAWADADKGPDDSLSDCDLRVW